MAFHTTGSAKGTRTSNNTLSKSLNFTGSPTLSRKFSGSIHDTTIPALSKSSDILEGEYIKNLQRQIFYLEMETKYLREQVKRASDLQPVMAGEAAKMLEQLRVLTAERDSLRLEVARRDANNEILRNEKGVAVATLTETQTRLELDKRALLDQVVELQGRNSVLQINNDAKDQQITTLRIEVEAANQKVNDLEARLQLSIKQHDATSERLRQTQIEVERKHVDIAAKDSQIRSLDAQLYDATVVSKDKSAELLNAEILALRTRLRDAEAKAEQERRIALTASVRSLEDAYNLRSTAFPSLADLKLSSTATPSLTDSALFSATVADRQRLQSEADFTRSALWTEKEHADQLSNQLRIAEDRASRAEVNSQAMKNRVHEIEAQKTATNTEASQLRNEKAVLINHIQEMQREGSQRDLELATLRKKMGELQRSIQAE